jgi:hypothetical protein
VLVRQGRQKCFNRRNILGVLRIALTLHFVQDLKPDTTSRRNGSHAKVSLSQLRVLLEVVMPLRQNDIESAIELVKWI